ncbi:MAG: cytochrome c [Winogradskyella sp.]|uniref:c-type cytochrome n=1 Tax=Winogradskyella sp. TaxID=1883156 RepID=UPI001791EDD2|nr:cytochrome c [Winogradskyella sp.]
MKIDAKYTVVLVMLVGFISCQENARPNYQYMPNMYESVGYETYQEADVDVEGNQIFEYDMEARLPVDGTIPRGDFMPFEIDNTVEGYEEAKANLKSPLDSTQVDYEVGGPLYTIYCAICHGIKGAGDGTLAKKDLIIPGSYAEKDITIGSIYHTIYYGKNSMGSYANQLNESERWQVAEYVAKLKADLDK